MSVHEIIIIIMTVFAVLGAVDKILGNRLGLGKEFEEGIQAMGSLALAMVGIITLAPVLANLLRPVIVPVFEFLGADPAMFAGTILASDMGGGALAQELTSDPQAAMLGGVITGSMLGVLVGSILPVSTEGIDFALTALFVTVFVEQWKSTQDHIPALIGVVCSLVCVIAFGPGSFLIPAMIIIALALCLRKKEGNHD